MKRRNFLVGAGAASIGGSALLGSGAFSRVESDRSVSIAVAEDPDAYLGLDKCPDSPNGSYAHLDDKGHLTIYMDDENPTIGETDLGEGINSNSTSWFHNVFQICNQGKEQACVWIEDDDWPTVPEGYPPHVGDNRIEFYVGADEHLSIVGKENAVQMDVGECLCVGIRVKSYGLEAGERILEDIGDQITINADVDGFCLPEGEQCPVYGISQGTGEQFIEAISVPNVFDTQAIVSLGDYDENEQFYPNGLAFDDGNGDWYFATEDGMLHVYDGVGFEEVGDIGDGESVAGAAWFMDSHYYFVPNGSTELKRADTDGDVDSVGDLGIEESINLGDVAIDDSVVYISTSSSGDAGAMFIEVELGSDPSTIEDVSIIAHEDDPGVDPETHAINKQIAFGPDGVLWAHFAGSSPAAGQWYTVEDLGTGEMSEELATTKMYTDLAQCAFPPF